MEYFYNPSKSLAVLFDDGTVFCWSANSPKFKEACSIILIKEDEEAAKMLVNETKAIMEGKVDIKNGKVNGVKTDSKLMKLIQLISDKGVCKESIEHIKPFLEKCIMNPYINGVEEIFDFITKLELKITSDGCFLAYKNVNSDLTSPHDCKTLNAPGSTVEVNEFDTDRTHTCSQGLHFCSKDYLDCYPGAITICVKVDPMDVVSIPIDYHFEKGRCKKYYIVGVMPTGKFFSDPDFDVADYFQIDVVDLKNEATEDEDSTTVAPDEPKPVSEKITPRLKEIYNTYIMVGTEKTAKKLGLAKSSVERAIRKVKQYLRESGD